MLFHVRDKQRRTTTGRNDTLAGSVAGLIGLMLLPSLPDQPYCTASIYGGSGESREGILWEGKPSI